MRLIRYLLLPLPRAYHAVRAILISWEIDRANRLAHELLTTADALEARAENLGHQLRAAKRKARGL